eukprot:Selendium_serpulae@DN3138_c0_g1_i1.p1
MRRPAAPPHGHRRLVAPIVVVAVLALLTARPLAAARAPFASAPLLAPRRAAPPRGLSEGRRAARRLRATPSVRRTTLRGLVNNQAASVTAETDTRLPIRQPISMNSGGHLLAYGGELHRTVSSLMSLVSYCKRTISLKLYLTEVAKDSSPEGLGAVFGDNTSVFLLETCSSPRTKRAFSHAGVFKAHLGRKSSVWYETVQHWGQKAIFKPTPLGVNRVVKSFFLSADCKLNMASQESGAAMTCLAPTITIVGPNCRVRALTLVLNRNGEAVRTELRVTATALSSPVDFRSYSKILSVGTADVTVKGSFNLNDEGLPYLFANTYVQLCRYLFLGGGYRLVLANELRARGLASRVVAEARVRVVSEQEVFYMTQRGLTKDSITLLIARSFLRGAGMYSGRLYYNALLKSGRFNHQGLSRRGLVRSTADDR